MSMFSSKNLKILGFTLALVALSAAIAFTYLALVIPGVGASGTLKAMQDAANRFDVSSVEEASDVAPLSELPSTTLQLISSDIGHEATLNDSPLGLPLNVLSRSDQKSLHNIQIQQLPDASTSDFVFDFLFYSSEFNDYKAGGSYQQAAEDFFFVNNRRMLDSVAYTSTPTASGGRDVDVQVTTSYSFDGNGLDSAESLWKELVMFFGDSEKLAEGRLVNLELHDAVGISVSASFSSEDEVKYALSIPKQLWQTFGEYLYSSSLKAVSAVSVAYRVGDTGERASLTVTTDPKAKEQSKLYEILTKHQASGAPFLIIWSHNTFFITAEEEQPFLTVYSSSRSWD